MHIPYPPEWDQLPKNHRRKKIKQLKRETLRKNEKLKKWRHIGLVILATALLAGGFWFTTKKSPEQIKQETEFQKQLAAVTLDGIEEFPIEGRDHIQPGENVAYKTNPPTSGGHYGQAEGWGVYDEEINDEAAVHNLEHGGIWISYTDISNEEKGILEQIGRDNPGSVVVSPRPANDDKIVVASWGRIMRLDTEVDRALIQKYIDTYKNDSPEKLAR